MLTPIAAVIIDAFAVVIQAFSLIQMKISHQIAEKLETEGKKSNPWCSVRMLVGGVVLTLLANIIHTMMLPFADMSLLASTNSISILSSCFFSIKLLGETFVW